MTELKGYENPGTLRDQHPESAEDWRRHHRQFRERGRLRSRQRVEAAIWKAARVAPCANACNRPCQPGGYGPSPLLYSSPGRRDEREGNREPRNSVETGVVFTRKQDLTVQ